MRLLIVEDDPSIAEPLVSGLERQGYAVTWVKTGVDALNAPEHDLVLLDLGLPDLDGQVVCRRLRERSTVPIVVVTARSDELDRVTLLELGADDYVVKPYGFRELVARIRAVLRRTARDDVGEDPTGRLEVGNLTIDQRTRGVKVGDAELFLTPKEYDLLLLLAEDAGAVFTRDQILRAVWDENWWGSTKTLDVHVASLRKKLGDPSLIETVRGVGYRMRS
ncbi:MAG: response regulator transcription factor [Acidimicrobiia bacterium]|nr:response regulator transcription factor [Acidimicrobiia bacterium]MDH4308196.1 response regulator transcription factor [Acidimicrobiia bacterium]